MMQNLPSCVDRVDGDFVFSWLTVLPNSIDFAAHDEIAAKTPTINQYDWAQPAEGASIQVPVGVHVEKSNP